MSAAAPLDVVLAQLQGVKQSGDGFTAKCPAHEDAHASLSIGTGEQGQVLLHCHKGCDLDSIVKALGLELTALWPSTEDVRPVERRYEIRGVDGALWAYHQRVDKADGKIMWWLRPDGTRGLGGIHGADLPLYGSERLSALAPGTTVVVTEGEKAADAVLAAGIAAVGTVTGAAGTPTDEILESLRGFDVVLWPDNDTDGARHMQRIGARLEALQIPYRVVVWTDAPPKADAANAARAFVPELVFVSVSPYRGLSTNTNNKGPRVMRFQTARELAAELPETPDAIVPGLVIRGAITELTGQVKRAGKTTFTLAMVAAIVEAGEFLGQQTRQTSVVYLTEQSTSSLKPGLERAGLTERDDLHILSYHNTIGYEWGQIVEFAVSEAKLRGASLLIVDTLSQFAHLAEDQENDSGAALSALAPLQKAIATDDLAILVIRHDRKSGGEVGESGRGSSAFAGAVDIVLQLRREDGNRPRIRMLNGIGRFDGTPDAMLIELDEATQHYVVLGDQDTVTRKLARTHLLTAAPQLESAAMTLDALTADFTSVGRKIAYAVSAELVTAGELQRTGTGRRGKPYKFWRYTPPHLTSGVSVSDTRKDSFPYSDPLREETRNETVSGTNDDYYLNLIEDEEEGT